MNNYSDEQLVGLYLAGDREALNFLIRRYLGAIYNYAFSYVKDRDAAEDLTQEVFVKVWKKIKKYDKKYKFKNWLYKIAKNTSLDYLKRNKAVNFSALNVDDGRLFEELVKENSLSPLAELELMQEKSRLNSAVEKLPDKYKQVLKLHYHGGYKFREIADILKISIETVKSRNRRALIRLEKFFKS